MTRQGLAMEVLCHQLGVESVTLQIPYSALQDGHCQEFQLVLVGS